MLPPISSNSQNIAFSKKPRRVIAVMKVESVLAIGSNDYLNGKNDEPHHPSQETSFALILRKEMKK